MVERRVSVIHFMRYKNSSAVCVLNVARTRLFALQYVHRNPADMPRASRAMPATVYIALVGARLLVVGEGARIARSIRSRGAHGISFYKSIKISHLHGTIRVLTL